MGGEEGGGERWGEEGQGKVRLSRAARGEGRQGEEEM